MSFYEFCRDEDGAVTVDWVALTAGMLLLGVAVIYAVFDGGVTPQVSEINDRLNTNWEPLPVPDRPDFS